MYKDLKLQRSLASCSEIYDEQMANTQCKLCDPFMNNEFIDRNKKLILEVNSTIYQKMKFDKISSGEVLERIHGLFTIRKN